MLELLLRGRIWIKLKAKRFNDCRAFTQAEVIFGAGQSQGPVVCLVLGTGIAGGVSIDGVLINNGDGQSGEFSHVPIPQPVSSNDNTSAMVW
jgi:predicted NBD/HSP70 family sugar kinase